jgi:nucleoid DNA-binding protein
MRKPQWIALVALLGTLGLLLGVADPARSQRPQRQQAAPLTLKERIVNATKLKAPDVQSMLTALGPAIREQLRAGAAVTVEGLGTFRVVRIPEHRDMVDGRPATIGASNYVEFLPTGEVVAAANAAGAVPAETVPAFEYIIDPYQTPGMRVGTTRNPGTRTR